MPTFLTIQASNAPKTNHTSFQFSMQQALICSWFASCTIDTLSYLFKPFRYALFGSQTISPDVAKRITSILRKSNMPTNMSFKQANKFWSTVGNYAFSNYSTMFISNIVRKKFSDNSLPSHELEQITSDIVRSAVMIKHNYDLKMSVSGMSIPIITYIFFSSLPLIVKKIKTITGDNKAINTFEKLAKKCSESFLIKITTSLVLFLSFVLWNEKNITKKTTTALNQIGIHYNNPQWTFTHPLAPLSNFT